MLTCVAFGASKYETQILTKGLSSNLISSVNPIMKSSGQTMGLEINKIVRFIDVVNFRPEESLEYIISEMVKENIPLKFTRDYFSSEIQYIMQSYNAKVPCYNSMAEYIDLQEKHIVFSGDEFRNKLTGVGITDTEYRDSVKLLEKFSHDRKMYNRVLMSSKCLLLADFFEHFRSELFEEYGIDVSQCSHDKRSDR